MKIVYVVGGLLAPNGMSSVLSAKINYLAEHTDYELYMILTERAGQKWYYTINPKVHWINFDINFDELDTMPLLKKLYFYQQKQRRYKKMFTDYLMEVRPDITVSTVRREINFINDIPDGSKKVGEIHFSRQFYRQLNKRYFPYCLNRIVSKMWMSGLIRNLKRLDSFIVLTHEDLSNWPELSNIRVIPNPLISNPNIRSKGNSKRVIAAGRYSWQKGYDLLIDAWEIVAEHCPDWTLEIYGAGNCMPYKRMVEEKGLIGKIFCNPATNNIYERYAQASLFVLSSRFEGFGLVIIEAMGAGLPVVSFACPCGPKDIIEDSVNGLLVKNGDVNQLAMKLIFLMQKDDIRKTMIPHALRTASNYDIDHIMKLWMNLFEGL